MADMILRDVLDNDVDTLSQMIARAWNSDMDEEKAFFASRDELLAHLIISTWGVVAARSNAPETPLGLMFACWHGASPLDERHWTKKLEEQRLEAQRAGVDITGALGVVKESAALMHKVGVERGADDVGELELLVVAEDARGVGLGRYLLLEGIAYLGSCGAKRFRLATDDSCDWEIYEHLHMQRVGTALCTCTGGGKLNLYIYEGNVADFV